MRSSICPSACVEQLRAGVVTADDGLDAIERARRSARPDEMPGRLRDACVHRQVVVPGGDDQVGPGDQAVVVNLVVMDQRTARRFGDADAFTIVRFGEGTHARSRISGCASNFAEALQGVEDFDEARVMKVERAEDGAARLQRPNSASSCSASGVPMRSQMLRRQRPDAVQARG